MAIFLFAGHGGADSGAVGVNKRTEASETIKMRNAVASFIDKTKFKVVLDNDKDSLRDVLAKAQTGAGSVVVDFHFNAAGNPQAGGVEVLVGDDAQADDLLLAHDMLDAAIEVTGLRNRGVKKESDTPRKRLGVMREHGAVCLIELCFISNPTDMAVYDKSMLKLAEKFAEIVCKHDSLK